MTATNLRGSAKYLKARARLERARGLAWMAQEDMRAAMASHVGDAALDWMLVSLAAGDADPIYVWPGTLDEAVARVESWRGTVEGGAA